jgi:hypothetical protein
VVSARLHTHLRTAVAPSILARTAVEVTRATTTQFIIYYGLFTVAEVQYVLCFLLSNTSEDLMQM